MLGIKLVVVVSLAKRHRVSNNSASIKSSSTVLATSACVVWSFSEVIGLSPTKIRAELTKSIFVLLTDHLPIKKRVSRTMKEPKTVHTHPIPRRDLSAVSCSYCIQVACIYSATCICIYNYLTDTIRCFD